MVISVEERSTRDQCLVELDRDMNDQRWTKEENMEERVGAV